MGGKKVRVAVLYGGRSGEHEVSLRSAASVLRHLDPARFEIVPIGIDKQGKWHMGDVRLLKNAGESLPLSLDMPQVLLPPNPAGTSASLVLVANGVASAPAAAGGVAIDVVFPVMHGPLCEDGTIQGLLELADLPYVGCGVLASAVGMDKDVAKRLARDAGLPIVPFITVKQGALKTGQSVAEPDALAERVARELGYPVFVKPANMGSSVGVHKVREASKLRGALQDAFLYDTKVLIERAIDAREVEVSVLENPNPGEPPLVSVPGEIAPSHEFYSYEAKYLDENGAALMIPAKLSAEQTAEVQKLAQEIFTALECEGMARVDLFVDRGTGAIYFNEINTLPGFTSISMYPKMWEASGLPYRELLTKLIELALARHGRKQAIAREFKGSER